MKAVSWNDIVVKLTPYFKDIYFFRTGEFYAGPDSIKQGCGMYFGMLDEHAKEALYKTVFDQYPEIKMIKIFELRNAKDLEIQGIERTRGDNYELYLEEEEALAVHQKYEAAYEDVRNTTDWRYMTLTEREMELLFTDGKIIDYTIPNSDFTIELSKTIFPRCTSKRIALVTMTYLLRKSDDGELDMLYLLYNVPGDFFTIFLKYRYLLY